MKRRELFLLFTIGLLYYLGVSWSQRVPGYMDADYYFGGGLRLVQGHGFTETVLWNYLDNPQSLPHPSHGYWYPLASIIAAAGMFIIGQQTFLAARLPFIIIAALAAPISASLGFRLTLNRGVAFTAGLLAVFGGYYSPFMGTTDNYAVFMVLGGLFFILILSEQKLSFFFLGLVAGLLNLARVDGIIWLFLAILGISIRFMSIPKPGLLLQSGRSQINIDNKNSKFQRMQVEKTGIHELVSPLILLILGYGLVMGPWMIRNYLIWQTPFTASGSRVLWMTKYSDTFAWPADRLNFQNWLAS